MAQMTRCANKKCRLMFPVHKGVYREGHLFCTECGKAIAIPKDQVEDVPRFRYTSIERARVLHPRSIAAT